MLADPVVAETTTLLGQRGSGVKLGNMLLIPLEGITVKKTYYCTYGPCTWKQVEANLQSNK